MRLPGITRQRKFFAVIGGIAAFTAILGTTTTSPSAAATTPAAQQGPTGNAYSAPPAGPDARARISCKLSIEPPQVSTDTPGTVVVAATVACTAPVSTLGISVDLYRNGVVVGSSGPLSNNNSATIQANATTACSSNPADRYFGKVDGNVTYPPGYTPPSWSASTRSFTFDGLNC